VTDFVKNFSDYLTCLGSVCGSIVKSSSEVSSEGSRLEHQTEENFKWREFNTEIIDMMLKLNIK
jgi:hypothetical protein